MNLTLSITGMSCGSCQRHVQQALVSVDGVQSAVVDLANARAEVVCEPGRVSPEQLVAAVEAEGYGASLAAQS